MKQKLKLIFLSILLFTKVEFTQCLFEEFVGNLGSCCFATCLLTVANMFIYTFENQVKSRKDDWRVSHMEKEGKKGASDKKVLKNGDGKRD